MSPGTNFGNYMMQVLLDTFEALFIVAFLIWYRNIVCTIVLGIKEKAIFLLVWDRQEEII